MTEDGARDADTLRHAADRLRHRQQQQHFSEIEISRMHADNDGDHSHVLSGARLLMPKCNALDTDAHGRLIAVTEADGIRRTPTCASCHIWQLNFSKFTCHFWQVHPGGDRDRGRDVHSRPASHPTHKVARLSHALSVRGGRGGPNGSGAATHGPLGHRARRRARRHRRRRSC